MALSQDSRRSRAGSVFRPTRLAWFGLVCGAAAAATGRLVLAIDAAYFGELDQLANYDFTVVFPLVLVALIFSIGPSRTREAVLMRLGTIFQLALVIAVPRFSLQ